MKSLHFLHKFSISRETLISASGGRLVSQAFTRLKPDMQQLRSTDERKFEISARLLAHRAHRRCYILLYIVGYIFSRLNEAEK